MIADIKIKVKINTILNTYLTITHNKLIVEYKDWNGDYAYMR